MNEEFSKILSDLVGYPVNVDFKQSFEWKGIDNEIVLAVMQCKRLDRIAEALEYVNSNLIEIALSLDGIDKNLDNCMSHNGNNQFLCITGNISTY